MIQTVLRQFCREIAAQVTVRDNLKAESMIVTYPSEDNIRSCKIKFIFVRNVIRTCISGRIFNTWAAITNFTTMLPTKTARYTQLALRTKLVRMFAPMLFAKFGAASVI